MKYRILGSTHLKVSELSFGGASLLSHCGKRKSIKAINDAYDNGINLYDTSDYYSQGESELLLGKTLADRRKNIVIVTKGGLNVPSNVGYLNKFKNSLRPWARKLKPTKKISPMPKPSRVVTSIKRKNNFTATYISKAIENSLLRLQTDYIDVYLLHTPTVEELTDCDEVFKLLQTKVKEGKLRNFGASCNHVEELHKALDFTDRGVSVLELPINLIEQQPLRDISIRARDLGVGLIGRSPFYGKVIIDSVNAIKEGMELPEESKKLFENIIRIMDETGFTIQDICIQYSLNFPEISTLICGMLNPPNLQNNLASLYKQKLTKSQIDCLNNVENFPHQD